MKKVISFTIAVMFAANAFAQHGGAFGGFGRAAPARGGNMADGHGTFRGNIFVRGFGSSPGFPNLGIPAIAPIPPLNANGPFSFLDHRFGSRYSSRFYGSGFPLYYGGYDNGYGASPGIVVIEQPTPQVAPPKPPEVVRPVIHTYQESTTIGAPASREQTSFVIALNDGSRVLAAAVWVQDNVLHYRDPNDRSRQVPLQSVDRESTRKLNQERSLNLPLPAPQ